MNYIPNKCWQVWVLQGNNIINSLELSEQPTSEEVESYYQAGKILFPDERVKVKVVHIEWWGDAK
jgi:hypothetical protein